LSKFGSSSSSSPPTTMLFTENPPIFLYEDLKTQKDHKKINLHEGAKKFQNAWTNQAVMG